MRELPTIDWDAHNRIFEALVEPERDPVHEPEYPLGEIALALRLECWDYAKILPGVHGLGAQLGTENAGKGVVECKTRARMIGIAHRILLQVAPYEDEFRRWLASKNSKRGRLA